MPCSAKLFWSDPIAFDAPSQVHRVLTRVLPGRIIKPCFDAPIRAVANDGGYRVTGGGVDESAADAWEAAHWIIAAALGAEAEAAPGHIVLHAAGLRGTAGATVIAGESHAGKSSVAVHLAARSRPLLGDDRLILDAGANPPTATAIGLARKVRMPLPPDFAPDALAYARTAAQPGGGGADLLRWNPVIDLPAGTADPITRMIILSRDPSRQNTAWESLPAVEAVSTLLPLCGRHAGDAQTLVAMIATLARRVPVARLTAPNSAMAADALLEERNR